MPFFNLINWSLILERQQEFLIFRNQSVKDLLIFLGEF